MEEERWQFQVRDVWAIINQERQQEPQYIKFICKDDGDVAEYVLAYSENLFT
jgi:hypothetical protein